MFSMPVCFLILSFYDTHTATTMWSVYPYTAVCITYYKTAAHKWSRPITYLMLSYVVKIRLCMLSVAKKTYLTKLCRLESYVG